MPKVSRKARSAAISSRPERRTKAIEAIASGSDVRKDPVTLAHEFSASLDIGDLDFRRYTGHALGEQSKYVSCRFSADQVKQWGWLEIIHMTDLQIGHVTCKENRVIEFMDWVLEKPNRFVVLGGDIVDAWRMGSPGEPYENWFNPQKQVYKAVSLLARIAHRILGYVGGNHERRANAAFGDLGTLIATLLRVPYSGGQQIVDVHFGKHAPYSIDLWHGKGAGVTKGSKMNMLTAYAQQSQAHCVLVGHLHDALATWRWVKLLDPNNMRTNLRKQSCAMSSSFLEFWGSYGEVMGMTPGDVLMARVKLYADGASELTFR